MYRFVLKRVPFNFCVYSIGYDYLKLVKEFGNQLTNEQFETKRKKPIKRMVCSQSVAYVINSCNKFVCINPNNYDPQDLYLDSDSYFINFK